MRGMALVVMVCAGTAVGQTFPSWIGDEGNWFDAANWAFGSVPGGEDRALINNGGVAVVSGGNASIGVLGIGLDGMGSGGLRIESGTLAVSGALLPAVVLARDAGTAGFVEVVGTESVFEPFNLDVGRRGSASLEVRDGAVIEIDRLFNVAGRTLADDSTGARASVVVSGEGSVIRSRGSAFTSQMFLVAMGQEGRFDFLVEDGGQVDLSAAFLTAATTDLRSTFTVRGDGSVAAFTTLDTTRGLEALQVASADLTVSDGAELRVKPEETFGGELLGSVSLFGGGVLRGNGGVVFGDVELREGSRIEVGEGGVGRLDIVGNVFVNSPFPEFTRTVGFELAGTDDGEFDVLSLTQLELVDDPFDGRRLLDVEIATLEVRLLDGFSPEFGDVFEIVEFETLPDEVIPVFTEFGALDLPSLGGNLAFDVEYANTGITLVVVPTPGALGVLGLGVVAALRRRG